VARIASSSGRVNKKSSEKMSYSSSDQLGPSSSPLPCSPA
jgi:hypothetical protein